MGKMWNLWHGCHKYSEGCKHCYVYRGDAKRDIDSSIIKKTLSFDLPIQKNKKGEYKHASGTFFYTCFTSDFLLKDCDEWRKEAWAMIRERSDCMFLFITKRIERFKECMPSDWGEGYDNVVICCTCENQKQADIRLPIFKSLPIKHRCIICEPMLTKITLKGYLDETISEVIAGGESGAFARDCNFDWILQLCDECKKANVTFNFKQTGSYFIKDNKRYKIERKDQHKQAYLAGINFKGQGTDYLHK